jgi:peptidoglycan/xylan/chitin deacetylase (PgdA/CDA1 family)
MKLKLVVPPGTEPEARWAAETLLSVTGLAWGEDGDAIVHVGAPAPGAALALPWTGLAPAWHPAQLALASFDGIPVPTPGGRITLTDGVPDELLRATFALLSREEERLVATRDRWECFAGTASRLFELGVLERPLVNEWARLLAARLTAWAGARGQALEPAPAWPGGARFAAMLSHDVDEVRYGSVAEGVRLLALARGPRSYALRAGLTQVARGLAARGRDPYWNFERWLAAEERRGFTSSFYFCAGAPRRRHEYDARYRLADRVDFAGARGTVASLMRTLADRGWDVGLHGSYLSHVDAADLAAQRAEIARASGAPAVGTRQHYLRFDVARTFAAQEAAGFDHDSTLGYNEALGFRAGIAAPFHPWDAAARAPHALLELPLSTMDGTLFRTLGLSAEAAAARVRAQLEAVERVGGLAVLLWHPNSADESHYPGWWATWEAALDHLRERGAWVGSGRAVAEGWRTRSRS